MSCLLNVDDVRMRHGKGCSHCNASDAWQSASSNICPQCGTVWSLRGISFEVREGEILGLIGESGAGKSSFLDILLGTSGATSGDIYFSGYHDGARSIFAASEEERRRISNFDIGVVQQSPTKGLYPKVSAGGNVVERLLAAGFRNVGQMRERAESLLSTMELSGRLDFITNTFSAGMQQRVQIAKALANNPRLLLLDEPTTGLDVCVQARTLDLLRQVHRDLGVSMILVTHDWNVLKLLATRAIVLKNGLVIEHGLVEQIFEDPRHPYTQLLIHSSL